MSIKWVFIGAFIFSALLSIIAVVTMPHEKVHGVAQLVWATDDNPARQEQMQLFRDWHVKQYGEPIDIRIDPGNYSADKIVIQSLAGVGPDLFDFFSRASLESYVKTGILLDVTDEARTHGFGPEIVWPGVRPSFMFEGRQYAFPDNTCNFLVVYHRDLFRQAGIPDPPPHWTWQEFLKVAKRLSYKRKDGIRQFAITNVDPLVMIMSNKAQFFTPDGTRCVIDSPQAIEAFQFYDDLSHKYHVIPTASDIASQASTGGWGAANSNLFATKYYAMKWAGRYEYIAWARDTRALLAQGKQPLLDLGIAELPRFAVPYGRVGARCTGINRNSRNVKYALRFLEFLASEEFNRQINRTFDGLASVSQYCNGPTGIADGPAPPPGLATANDPLWATTMSYGQENPSSPFIPSNKFERLFYEAVDMVNAGALTPEAALHRVAKLVNKEIQLNIAQEPELKALYEQRLRQGESR